MGKITKTREKLQKTHKKKTAAYVSADLVGHFFLFAEKGKSSSNRTWYCLFPLPCSFHPPCLTSYEGWIFLPSSCAGIITSWGGKSENVGIFIWCFCENNCVRISVSRGHMNVDMNMTVNVDVISRMCSKEWNCMNWIRCHYSSVHQQLKRESQPLYIPNHVQK